MVLWGTKCFLFYFQYRRQLQIYWSLAVMVVHAVTRIQMSTKFIKHRNFTNHVCQSLPYESLAYIPVSIKAGIYDSQQLLAIWLVALSQGSSSLVKQTQPSSISQSYHPLTNILDIYIYICKELEIKTNLQIQQLTEISSLIRSRTNLKSSFVSATGSRK